MAEIDLQTATIAAGQAISGPVAIGNKELVGLQVPSNWTTAAITLQASIDGGQTWSEVWDGTAGTEVEIPSLTGGSLQYYVAIDPTKLRGISLFQIRSGTQASPVNQSNLVSVTLITRLVF